ncbi:hypothetical protein [Nocardioides sp. Iso805N]|uniref:hypothetical protein n=1 Tax=Nocardioides sp. Iso805N TaxID=1283287 RepID=UPI0003A6F39C|nr:hypothetical protein [Nocardioides sp. Iso805N]
MPEPLVGSRMWRRLDLLIGAALLAGVLLRALLFHQVSHTPFSGDEVAYVDGGKALSNLLRDLAGLHGPDTAELRRDLIGSGWFMPGMALLLTPLYLVDPHASLAVARGWLGLIALVVYVLVVLDVRRVVGRWWALGLALVPGLVPMWLLFGYTAYGDLLAGLVATLLITRMVAVLRRASDGVVPRLAEGALIGFLAIATVYLRSSSTPLVFGIGLVGLMALLWCGRRALPPLLLAGGLFVALLVPWSIAASATFDTRVITTTSVPMAMANTFGDRTKVCYGMCDPGSTIWFSPVRYAREVARATGTSEVTVLSQMSAYARQDVTPHSYARDVIADWHNYRDDPTAFLFKLHPPGQRSSATARAVEHWTLRVFGPTVRLAALGLLVITRRSRRAQLLSVLVKVGLLGLLLQPFVHVAGARYWTTAAPLAALSGMLAVWVVLGWVVRRVRGERGPIEPPSRLLTLAQGGLAAIGVAAVVTIQLLA